MNDTLKTLLKPLASLRLTVALMAIGIWLIFAGTWAQIDKGIWRVMSEYFRCWFTWIEVQVFLPRDWQVPGVLPWPGGYTIAVLLLANLLAAHSARFKFTWKRSGIHLIHASLILLIVGEAVTGFKALETQMPIYVGGSSNWTHDLREVELAVIDSSGQQYDRVMAVPQSVLKRAARTGNAIVDEKLPFDIRVNQYMTNSTIFRLGADQQGQAPATHGFGRQFGVSAVREVSGVDESTVNFPAAVITLSHQKKELGRHLVSPHFQQPLYIVLGQDVVCDGKTYEIYLRFRRYQKPYTVELAKFHHDFYPGTKIHKNFRSDIHLIDPGRHDERRLGVYMNHPLRYHGETFFQSGWIPDEAGGPDRGTVLQVVDNPGWLIPYIACVIGGIGLIVHFGMTLVQFLNRSAKRAAEQTTDDVRPTGALGHYIPWAAVLAVLMLLIVAARPPSSPSAFDIHAFGRLPVVHGGRTKPMDTVARNSLLVFSGRQTLEYEDDRLPAIQWLLDALTQSEVTNDYETFLIEHPDLLALLGREDEARTRVSNATIADNITALQEQAMLVDEVPAKQRDPYQRKVAALANNLMTYRALAQWHNIFIVPPAPPLDKAPAPAPDKAPGKANQPWLNLSEASTHFRDTQHMLPGFAAYRDMFDAYDQKDATRFNQTVADFRQHLDQQYPSVTNRVGFESFFNHFAPFSWARVLYIAVGLLVMAYWLLPRRPIVSTAYKLLIVTLLLHTLALAARVYISGRPPVTNLYSSAIFIGWAVVVLCVILEQLYKNGIGTFLAAVIGFSTLLVAGALADDGNGDTMAVLQAVLDTNFWLATHVVAITIGYSATFLAGFLGIIYILRGVLTKSLTRDESKRMGQMIYGVVCFALLFSFVGTILGGIWADQSWGRFWGWDPKENGALLIVLWNALILHARWSGMAQQRGMAGLAVFGNIVTSWSWFGTNLLGVGLHAYGFIESGVFWMAVFVVSQLTVIAIACIPVQYWRSFAAAAPTAAVANVPVDPLAHDQPAARPRPDHA